MTRGHWLAVTLFVGLWCLAAERRRALQIVPSAAYDHRLWAAGEREASPLYHEPSADEARAWCELEGQKGNRCDLGVVVSCPPDCEVYQNVYLAVITGHARRIWSWQ